MAVNRRASYRSFAGQPTEILGHFFGLPPGEKLLLCSDRSIEVSDRRQSSAKVNMVRVLLTTCCPNWPMIRQTPKRLGVWEDYEFVIDQPGSVCDAWVVFDNLGETISATCAPENLFFVSAEPPEIRKYRRDFLNQFRWVVTCHETRHRGLIAAQQGHPWHVGVDADRGFIATLDYDALSAMDVPDKPHVLSTVISSKAITPAHRQRLAFVKQLKERLGDRFHVYGRGHQSIADKWEAVAPYRFHLAMENASRPDYLTEKVCDAFLGSSYPFYFGAPNAGSYFPKHSFEPIDIFQPEQAIEKICAAIDSQVDMRRRDEVQQARRVVLDELNLFAMLVRLLRQKLVDRPKRRLRLYPKGQHLQLAMSGVGRFLRRAA